VERICQRVGLERHTVNQSLGRWGRTEKLPPLEILELNTMCGHGRVTVGLIQDVIDSLGKGHCTPEQGAERLFRPCQCGTIEENDGGAPYWIWRQTHCQCGWQSRR
jgi:hypothetical protein